MSVQTFNEAEYILEARKLTETIAKYIGVDHVRVLAHPSDRVCDQRTRVPVV